ncbi:hypothetical protein ABPG72_008470 [Tetrahymena utriculariae]
MNNLFKVMLLISSAFCTSQSKRLNSKNKVKFQDDYKQSLAKKLQSLTIFHREDFSRADSSDNLSLSQDEIKQIQDCSSIANYSDSPGRDKFSFFSSSYQIIQNGEGKAVLKSYANGVVIAENLSQKENKYASFATDNVYLLNKQSYYRCYIKSQLVAQIQICPKGQYDNMSAFCNQCVQPLCAQCIQGSCLQCQIGSQIQELTQKLTCLQSIDQCQKGYYFDLQAKRCFKCHTPACESCSNSSFCQKCQDGFQLLNNKVCILKQIFQSNNGTSYQFQNSLQKAILGQSQSQSIIISEKQIGIYSTIDMKLVIWLLDLNQVEKYSSQNEEVIMNVIQIKNILNIFTNYALYSQDGVLFVAYFYITQQVQLINGYNIVDEKNYSIKLQNVIPFNSLPQAELFRGLKNQSTQINNQYISQFIVLNNLANDFPQKLDQVYQNENRQFIICRVLFSQILALKVNIDTQSMKVDKQYFYLDQPGKQEKKSLVKIQNYLSQLYEDVAIIGTKYNFDDQSYSIQISSIDQSISNNYKILNNLSAQTQILSINLISLQFDQTSNIFVVLQSSQQLLIGILVNNYVNIIMNYQFGPMAQFQLKSLYASAFQKTVSNINNENMRYFILVSDGDNQIIFIVFSLQNKALQQTLPIDWKQQQILIEFDQIFYDRNSNSLIIYFRNKDLDNYDLSGLTIYVYYFDQDQSQFNISNQQQKIYYSTNQIQFFQQQRYMFLKNKFKTAQITCDNDDNFIILSLGHPLRQFITQQQFEENLNLLSINSGISSLIIKNLPNLNQSKNQINSNDHPFFLIKIGGNMNIQFQYIDNLEMAVNPLQLKSSDQTFWFNIYETLIVCSEKQIRQYQIQKYQLILNYTFEHTSQLNNCFQVYLNPFIFCSNQGAFDFQKNNSTSSLSRLILIVYLYKIKGTYQVIQFNNIEFEVENMMLSPYFNNQGFYVVPNQFCMIFSQPDFASIVSFDLIDERNSYTCDFNPELSIYSIYSNETLSSYQFPVQYSGQTQQILKLAIPFNLQNDFSSNSKIFRKYFTFNQQDQYLYFLLINIQNGEIIQINNFSYSDSAQYFIVDIWEEKNVMISNNILISISDISLTLSFDSKQQSEISQISYSKLYNYIIYQANDSKSLVSLDVSEIFPINSQIDQISSRFSNYSINFYSVQKINQQYSNQALNQNQYLQNAEKQVILDVSNIFNELIKNQKINQQTIQTQYKIYLLYKDEVQKIFAFQFKFQAVIFNYNQQILEILDLEWYQCQLMISQSQSSPSKSIQQLEPQLIYNNQAEIGGGLRFFNQNNSQPTKLFTGQFKSQIINNKAEFFGNNITSIPFKIKFLSGLDYLKISLNQFSTSLLFQVYGIDGELIKYNQQTIRFMQEGLEFLNQYQQFELISAQKSVQIENQVRTYNVEKNYFNITCNLLDYGYTELLEIQNKNEDLYQFYMKKRIVSLKVISNPLYQIDFQISFQKFQEGQLVLSLQQNLYQCYECNENTYSIINPQRNINSNQCEVCLVGAISCQGSKIQLEEGYWKQEGTYFVFYCHNKPQKCTQQVQLNKLKNPQNNSNGCIEGGYGPLCESRDYKNIFWGRDQDDSYAKINIRNCIYSVYFLSADQ